MSNETVIKVERISKKYSKSLKRSMIYGVTDIGRNMLGLSSRSEKLRKSEFWAVDGVSFEVKQGETFGIIGINGSGKTTLLKMLNGVFWPDKGKITVKGKVGALIQVGAGFHPMLSGKDNIYVNGAILGMNKREIDKKFDSIIEFADIGDFLDTPVKFYSSGMYVRLGFAIAAHSEPDILLVDEILAVGDVFFRRKALERIQQIKKKGTAIVFVSHDMGTVEGFCDTGIYLKKGRIMSHGPISSVVARYQEVNLDPQVLKDKDPNFRNLLISEKITAETYSTKELDVADLALLDKEGKQCEVFPTNGEMRIVITILPKRKIEDCIMSISARRSDGLRCFMERSCFHDFEFSVLDKHKYYQVEVKLSPLQLTIGAYALHVAFSDRGLVQPFGRRGGLDVFRITDNMPNPNYSEGVYHPSMEWKLLEINERVNYEANPPQCNV